MSSSKEIGLVAGVYLCETQNPIPPYPHTVYLFTQGSGGGEELNQKEG